MAKQHLHNSMPNHSSGHAALRPDPTPKCCRPLPLTLLHCCCCCWCLHSVAPALPPLLLPQEVADTLLQLVPQLAWRSTDHPGQHYGRPNLQRNRPSGGPPVSTVAAAAAGTAQELSHPSTASLCGPPNWRRMLPARRAHAAAHSRAGVRIESGPGHRDVASASSSSCCSRPLCHTVPQHHTGVQAVPRPGVPAGKWREQNAVLGEGVHRSAAAAGCKQCRTCTSRWSSSIDKHDRWGCRGRCVRLAQLPTCCFAGRVAVDGCDAVFATAEERPSFRGVAAG
jgi:hypothetical protein